MSLLSPDTRIALLPGCAALARGAGTPMIEQQGEGWEGALAALNKLLDGARPTGRARVGLSHHFVRLFLLDPPAVYLRRREMQAWLGDVLSGSLGNVEDWRLAWPDLPPGRPIPVGAWPRQHHDALLTVLAEARLQPRSLQPWLGPAWHRRRRQLRGATGWYVLQEPGNACVMYLQRGRLRHLRQRRLHTADGADLAALLRREAVLAGVDGEGEVWLEATGAEGEASLAAGGWRLHRLATPVQPALALLP